MPGLRGRHDRTVRALTAPVADPPRQRSPTTPTRASYGGGAPGDTGLVMEEQQWVGS